MNTSSNVLLDEELDSDDEVNKELLGFYYANSSSLREILLSEIDPSILWTIASMLHSSSKDYGEQWREYGYSLGIKTHFELDDLEEKAGINKVLPLYLALVWALRQNISIGEIVTILIRKEKYHILRKLKPDIQTLLNTKSPSTSCNKDASSQGILNRSPVVNAYTGIRSFDFSESDLFSLKTCFTEKCIIKYDSKQNSSPLQSSVRMRNPKLSESCLNVQPEPSAPPKNQLSVLIMQTTKDEDKTCGLLKSLREAHVNVLQLSDCESFLMDDSIGVVTYIFSRVDYIIPIVSLNLFQQIYPKNLDQHIDSEEAMNNSTLYKLLQNECRRNGWLKLRVRPMLVPGFDKRLLKDDLLFSSPLRLETEVPKLIRVLHQSKPRPNFFFV